MRHAVDKIELDTVFRMWQNGTDYEILPDEQAPEVFSDGPNVTIDSILSWFTVTNGMTGQYGYDGPIMHDSEFISEGMIEQILAEHDYRNHYFAVCPVVYSDPADVEGWVIIARPV